MIQLRLIDDLVNFHPIAMAWWQGHGWPGIPLQILPKLGIRAELAHPETDRDPVPLAAGWLYMDNSVGVAMLEWLVTDPHAPPLQTAKALAHLITFAKNEAKRLGYGIVLATCRQDSLSKLLQRHGFQVTDTGVTHHLLIL